MRFSRRRRDAERTREERGAFIVAVLVTAISFALILDRTNVRFRVDSAPSPLSEEVRWARVAPPREPTSVPVRTQRAPSESPQTTRAISQPTSASAPAVETPVQIDSGRAAPASPFGPSTRLLPSVPAKSLFDRTVAPTLQPREYTKEEMDSIARLRAEQFAEAAKRRLPTQAEKDEAWKELGRPGTIPGRTAGEQGSVATRGSGGGISVPFLSAGKSAEERKREAIAAEEGRAILARLQERARKKKDSIRIADSTLRARLP